MLWRQDSPADQAPPEFLTHRIQELQIKRLSFYSTVFGVVYWAVMITGPHTNFKIHFSFITHKVILLLSSETKKSATDEA